MPSTGQTCTVSGIYKCSTHTTHEIVMVKDKPFPPCDKAGPAKPHGANWVLVRAAKH